MKPFDPTKPVQTRDGRIEQHLKSQGVTCPTALRLHVERAKLICPGDTERYRVGGENPNALPINTMMG